MSNPKQLWNALDRGDLRTVAALSGVSLSSSFRCYNCALRFPLDRVRNLGGDLYCDECAHCLCGAPATTLDADGCISCGLCLGSKADGLGNPTGMIIYRAADWGITIGKVPADTNQKLARMFQRWDPKPRLYQEHERGCVEITREVWG